DIDGTLATFAINESTGGIGATIDTWEFRDGDTTRSVRIIKISGTTYAIVYSSVQTANDFRVKTFTVSDVGVITKTFIENLVIPTTNDEPQHGTDIIHISGDVYAIVYSEDSAGSGSLGMVITVTITSAGVISDAVVDSSQFTSVSKDAVSITKVGTTDYYAIAYIDGNSDPVVVTVSISSAGTITGPQVLTLRPNASGTFCDIDTESGAACPNHYQNVDEAVSDENTTRNYTATGATEKDTYNVPNHTTEEGIINSVKVVIRCRTTSSGSDAQAREVLHIDGTSYLGDINVLPADNTFHDYSFIWTVSPDTSNPFTWSEIDSMEIGVTLKSHGVGSGTAFVTQVYVEVDYGRRVLANVTATNMGNILRVPGTDYYAVAVGLTGTSGTIYTCSINSSGAITNGSNGNFDAADAEYCHMVSLGGDAFMVAYRGVDNDGFLVSITIDSAGAVGSIIESLEFLTTDVQTPFIIYLGYGNYVVTYGAQQEDDIECVTVGVASGFIYPTEAITRVTGLIHRHSRATGTYEIEVLLGDVGVDWARPVLKPKSEPTMLDLDPVITGFEQPPPREFGRGLPPLGLGTMPGLPGVTSADPVTLLGGGVGSGRRRGVSPTPARRRPVPVRPSEVAALNQQMREAAGIGDTVLPGARHDLFTSQIEQILRQPIPGTNRIRREPIVPPVRTRTGRGGGRPRVRGPVDDFARGFT
ncbi:hypothetical protein LCGC14_1744370, partial [marine sediment metagenome]